MRSHFAAQSLLAILLTSVIFSMDMTAQPKQISKRFNAQFLALRLGPGDDPRQALLDLCRTENISAGFVVSAVGSLRKAVFRLANRPDTMTLDYWNEVVALSGTLSKEGVHLHVSLTDSTGRATGGHMVDGSQVFTTLELVVGISNDLEFHREIDPATGFKELVIRSASPVAVPTKKD